MKPSNIKYYLKGYISYKRMTDAPVIIGGCERSGTSLLLSIISAAPDIYAIKEETWAFCYGPEAGFNSQRPIRPLRLLKYIGLEPPKPTHIRWCEKSPANIFDFDEILHHFNNNAKLIHIIRDGRDVVTSIHPNNKATTWVSIDRWIASASAGLKHMDNPAVLTIKYEDLILYFEETATKICNHINESHSDHIIEWHRHATIRTNKNLIGKKYKSSRQNLLGNSSRAISSTTLLLRS